MKNYFNLIGFFILFITGIKPFFDSNKINNYSLTGLNLPKYWYIIINLVLSILLLMNYINNRKNHKK